MATKKEIKEIERKCLYCGEVIAVLCGTPLIYIGGCCYGYTDEKNKIRHIFPRKAHIECWLKEKKLKLVKTRGGSN